MESTSDNFEVEISSVSRERAESSAIAPKVKKYKPGIVYLPNFPPYMTIMKAKELFSQFGEIGRTYFQPKEMKGKNKNKPSVHFSEGWIEFKSKKVAKEVAATLNNTTVGGKRRAKYYDCLWNVKYLPGFKWIHLNERLAYERAVRRHKLRLEIAQAKEEANIFSANVDKSVKPKKLQGSLNTNEIVKQNQYIQRQTESEIISAKSGSKKSEFDRADFLKSLFSNSS